MVHRVFVSTGVVAVVIKVHHPLSGTKIVVPESLLLMESTGRALLQINAALECLLGVNVIIFLIDSVELYQTTFTIILILPLKIT